jgi:hypothetical protein
MDRAIGGRLNDEDHEGIRGDYGETCKEHRGKARQFVVCALAKFIYDSAGYCRCSRELTWLASSMAPRISKSDIFFPI